MNIKDKELLLSQIDKVAFIGEVNDGYHTFNELYDYRKLYNAAFFNMLARFYGAVKVVKSKRHSDGEECFGGGWFIVMAELPTGQISNHYELKDWDLFQVPEVELAPKWDGHTPQQAAERLEAFLTGKQINPPKKKFYRLKHKPTGLYYKPLSGGSNLGKRGKIYQTVNNGLMSDSGNYTIKISNAQYEEFRSNPLCHFGTFPFDNYLVGNVEEDFEKEFIK